MHKFIPKINWSKGTALFIAVLFLLESFVWATPAPISEVVRSSAASSDGVNLPGLIEKIQIPSSLGSVQEVFDGAEFRATTPTLIHLEDAHGESDAQKNMQAILEHLRKKYGVTTFFLEGAWNKLDPELLRFSEDPVENKKILDELTQEGVAGGPELFLYEEHETKNKINGYGIEDLDLYTKNLEQFRAVMRTEKESAEFLSEIKMGLLAQASRVSNSELAEYFRNWSFHEEIQQNYDAHLRVLADFSAEHLGLDLNDPREQYDWPQLVRFQKLKLSERETSLDAWTTQIEAELKTFRRWLKSHQVSTPEFLVLGSGTREMFETFYEKAAPLGFKFKDYPALSKEWGKQILAKELDAVKLLEEVQKLENLLLDKLAQSPDEKKIITKYREYLLLKKLLHLELTREEWKQTSLGVVASKGLPPAISQTIEMAQQFYQVAELRDAAMVRRTIEWIKKEKIERAAIITGGFHSQGVREIFKKEKISYIRVQPHIAQIRGRENYLKHMVPNTSHLRAVSLAEPESARFPEFLAMLPERVTVSRRSENRDNSIAAVLRLIDIHYRELGQHSRMVGHLARLIAEELIPEASPQLLKDYQDAGTLHDAGKIELSLKLLKKRGALSPSEINRMREHPEKGVQVLNRFSGLKFAEEAVLYHHERFDGKGYPNGLTGDSIPIMARVVSVADAFDALISPRSYKKPMDWNKALKIIARDSGTYFDPQVVRAFRRALEKQFFNPAAQGLGLSARGGKEGMNLLAQAFSETSQINRSESRDPIEQKIQAILEQTKARELHMGDVHVKSGLFEPTDPGFMKAIEQKLEIDPSREMTLLDIGHGQGLFGLRLAMKYPNLKIIGVELDHELFVSSRKLVQAAEKQGFIKEGQIQYFGGDFFDSAFIDDLASVDLVYYYNQSFEDEERLAKHLAQNLKTNARIVIFDSLLDDQDWSDLIQMERRKLSPHADFRRPQEENALSANAFLLEALRTLWFEHRLSDDDGIQSIQVLEKMGARRRSEMRNGDVPTQGPSSRELFKRYRSVGIQKSGARRKAIEKINFFYDDKGTRIDWFGRILTFYYDGSAGWEKEAVLDVFEKKLRQLGFAPNIQFEKDATGNPAKPLILVLDDKDAYFRPIEKLYGKDYQIIKAKRLADAVWAVKSLPRLSRIISDTDLLGSPFRLFSNGRWSDIKGGVEFMRWLNTYFKTPEGRAKIPHGDQESKLILDAAAPGTVILHSTSFENIWHLLASNFKNRVLPQAWNPLAWFKWMISPLDRVLAVLLGRSLSRVKAQVAPWVTVQPKSVTFHSEKRSESRGEGEGVLSQNGVINKGGAEALAKQASVNFEAIRKHGFFAFDMQKTLVARKELVTDGMRDLLIWLLAEGVPVVVISANSREEVWHQLMEPLLAELQQRGQMESAENMIVYANSGTSKYWVNAHGQLQVDTAFSRQFRIGRGVEDAISKGLKDLAHKKFFLEEGEEKSFRGVYEKDKVKDDISTEIWFPWLEKEGPEAYEPSVVIRLRDEKQIQAPYIIRRGLLADDETGKGTALAVRQFLPNQRDKILPFLKAALEKELGLAANQIVLSGGGTSTIDVFNQKANKAFAFRDAAEFFQKRGRPIDLNYVAYHGDEVWRKASDAQTLIRGNDTVILDGDFGGDTAYQAFRVVAVNAKPPEGLSHEEEKRVTYVGGEQTGIEFYLGRLKALVDAARNSKIQFDETQYDEWVRLIELLSQIKSAKGAVYLHGRDLSELARDPKMFAEHIQHYSAIKDPADLTSLFEAKFFTLQTQKKIPEEKQALAMIFDALFDRESFLKPYSSAHPFKVVMFRGGRGASKFTELLKKIPNIQISLILGAVDDGRGWYLAARDFRAPGVPDAGKALLDLAGDEAAKAFLENRLRGDLAGKLQKDFLKLIQKMEGVLPEDVVFSYPETQKIYEAFLKVGGQKQKTISHYLNVFYRVWQTEYHQSRFGLDYIPLRSLLILGAAWHFKEQGSSLGYWQQAVDEIAVLLGVKKGDRVIFPTPKQQHLVALAADGTIYFAETGINEYRNKKAPFVGLWLFDRPIGPSDLTPHLNPWIQIKPISFGFEEMEMYSDGLKKEILETTRKVSPEYVRNLADVLSSLSTNGTKSKRKLFASTEVLNAIKGAHLIVYANTTFESNIGSSLIVPGIGRAIYEAKGAKVLFVNPTDEAEPIGTTAVEIIKRLLLYAGGMTLYGRVANRFVEFALGIEDGYEKLDPKKKYIPFDQAEIHRTFQALSTIGLNLELKQPVERPSADYRLVGKEWGFYDPELLVSTLFAAAGIKQAGYRIDPFGRLEKIASFKVRSEARMMQLISLKDKWNDYLYAKNEQTLIPEWFLALFFIGKHAWSKLPTKPSPPGTREAVFSDNPDRDAYRGLIRDQRVEKRSEMRPLKDSDKRYEEVVEDVLKSLEEIQGKGGAGARALKKLIGWQIAVEKRRIRDFGPEGRFIKRKERVYAPAQIIVGHLKRRSFYSTYQSEIALFFSQLARKDPALFDKLFEMIAQDAEHQRNDSDPDRRRQGLACVGFLQYFLDGAREKEGDLYERVLRILVEYAPTVPLVKSRQKKGAVTKSSIQLNTGLSDKLPPTTSRSEMRKQRMTPDEAVNYEGKLYSFRKLLKMLQDPKESNLALIILEALREPQRKVFLETIPMDFSEISDKVRRHFGAPEGPRLVSLSNRALKGEDFQARFNGVFRIGIGESIEKSPVVFEIDPQIINAPLMRIRVDGTETSDEVETDKVYMIAKQMVEGEEGSADFFTEIDSDALSSGKHFSFMISREGSGFTIRIVDYGSTNGTVIAGHIYPGTSNYGTRDEKLEEYRRELQHVLADASERLKQDEDDPIENRPLSHYKTALKSAANLYVLSAEFKELLELRKEVIKTYFTSNVVGRSNARRRYALVIMGIFFRDDRVSVWLPALEVVTDLLPFADRVDSFRHLFKTLEEEQLKQIPSNLKRKIGRILAGIEDVSLNQSSNFALPSNLSQTQRIELSGGMSKPKDKSDGAAGSRSEARKTALEVEQEFRDRFPKDYEMMLAVFGETVLQNAAIEKFFDKLVLNEKHPMLEKRAQYFATLLRMEGEGFFSDEYPMTYQVQRGKKKETRVIEYPDLPQDFLDWAVRMHLPREEFAMAYGFYVELMESEKARQGAQTIFRIRAGNKLGEQLFNQVRVARKNQPKAPFTFYKGDLVSVNELRWLKTLQFPNEVRSMLASAGVQPESLRMGVHDAKFLGRDGVYDPYLFTSDKKFLADVSQVIDQKLTEESLLGYAQIQVLGGVPTVTAFKSRFYLPYTINHDLWNYIQASMKAFVFLIERHADEILKARQPVSKMRFVTPGYFLTGLKTDESTLLHYYSELPRAAGFSLKTLPGPITGVYQPINFVFEKMIISPGANRSETRSPVVASDGLQYETWESYVPYGLVRDQDIPQSWKDGSYAFFSDPFYQETEYTRFMLDQFAELIKRRGVQIPEKPKILLGGIGTSVEELDTLVDLLDPSEVDIIDFQANSVRKVAEHLGKRKLSPEKYRVHQVSLFDLLHPKANRKVVPPASVDLMYVVAVGQQGGQGSEGLTDEILRVLKPGGYAFVSDSNEIYQILLASKGDFIDFDRGYLFRKGSNRSEALESKQANEEAGRDQTAELAGHTFSVDFVTAMTRSEFRAWINRYFPEVITEQNQRMRERARQIVGMSKNLKEGIVLSPGMIRQRGIAQALNLLLPGEKLAVLANDAIEIPAEIKARVDVYQNWSLAVAGLKAQKVSLWMTAEEDPKWGELINQVPATSREIWTNRRLARLFSALGLEAIAAQLLGSKHILSAA